MSLSLLQRRLSCLPGTSSLAAALSCCRWTPVRQQSTQTKQARKQIDEVWDMSEQTSMGSKKPYRSRHESQSPADRWSLTSSNFMDRAAQPGNTYSGRSVEVNDGDIGNAFRRLDAIMGRNNVWAELRKTRHERKGEKRRRLESERWRRRFKEEVKKRVQMVLEIRRRGA
ncbi:hypothetical protein SCHPADRAFT_993473 [Schizopora paradoxa]|uniref:Uncharacterized protein n=1 Tax=Schizopora paradoxa TaxID=27342 RepID=A0A0H2S3N4_9AGAM|nr:hypothetical protein SCHPADRAFT_993473 [Schizopora paradoxa]